MANEKNQPIKKMNIGAVNLAIWQNDVRSERDGDTRTMYSVTAERRYKDHSGTWQSSNSFRTNDIPKLSLLLNKAYEYLTMVADNAGSGTHDGDGDEA